MTRRQLLAAAGGVPLLQKHGHAARKPNVIFLLTDDHGAWSMGAYGCSEFHTPNLDRLAAGGARFSRAYASTPVCSPSRMTYLTGTLPAVHGVQDAMLGVDRWGPRRRRFLDAHLTFSEVLAKNGYTLGMCGKWHMGDDDNPHAGFTYWCTQAQKGGGYKDPTLVKNGSNVKINGFLTDALVDAGIEFIDMNKSRPFCLYVPFYAPHMSYSYQPEEYRQPYADSKFPCFPQVGKHPQRRRRFERLHGNRESMRSYSALITGVDHNVGRIVRRLEELGLREDTLIVFSADQGWNAGHHGVWGKGNATIPFNMYEESIRVPLIWNHPGKIAAAQTPSAMVSSYDFFPTILDYLGMTAPADPRRVGRSYAGFLRGESPPWPNELYFEYCYARAVRTENWKYVERGDNWGSELFDLEADPGETVNVIGARGYEKQLADLRGRLGRFFQAAGGPPLEIWRSTLRQVLTVDTGYYDSWLEFRRR
jgi:arylsulfatase A-like enzyme